MFLLQMKRYKELQYEQKSNDMKEKNDHTHDPKYTGHTQKNGAVSIMNIIETAPFFCVYPVYNTQSYESACLQDRMF